MENRIVVPIKKNPTPIIVVEGHEFRLQMTESEIMAELAAILAKSGEVYRDVKGQQEIALDGADTLSDEKMETMLTMGKTATDTSTAGRALIDKMLGNGAYKTITDGFFYTSQDDLEIAAQIVTAVRERAAEERRAKLNAPTVKKSRAKK